MSEYRLADNLFLYPTPVGAYYAVASPEQNRSRKFIKKLLHQTETPVLNIENLMQLMDEKDKNKALDFLDHCQKLGWVQGIETAVKAPADPLEKILPALLESMTETGKVLLADDQGFYLACSGFPHEVAEELSALSAEIATVHKRRLGLLMNNLGIASHAWAIVDAFGSSQTGFWPIFIGKNRFVIVISGIPHFNQSDFISLVWALNIRYAK